MPNPAIERGAMYLDELVSQKIKEDESPKDVVDLSGAVSRLASIPSLEYELVRESEAQKLGVRVSILDKEVKGARGADSKNEPISFNDVVSWRDPVNGHELLDEIHRAVSLYIVCDPETRIAATLWIAFTWFITRVSVAPLAVITAPEKRCGKSTLLHFLSFLVRKPLLASNISQSAVFRVIEAYEPTLLIDEADTFFRDNEPLRGVINSGHTRQSAYVIRTVGDDHEPKQFSTWSAKAISGIGNLSGTLMDRAIVLKLRRKLPSEKAERLRHAEKSQFRILASKLSRLAEDIGDQVENARPELPDALNDRAQDNWEPLLAIADCIGGDWPRLARNAAQKISGVEQDSGSISIELLSDAQEILNSENYRSRQFIPTADLLSELVKDELRPWATYNRGKPIAPRQLAMRLGEFGIKSKDKRHHLKVFKAFMREDFDDVFARYLTSPPAYVPQSATPLQASCDAGLSVADDPQRCGKESLSATLEAPPHKGCSGVADKTPPNSKESIEVEI